MLPEDRKALMLRYYAAWEAGDLDGLHDCIAEECINYHPETGAERDGIDLELSTCEMWHESFNDVKVTIKQALVDGEFVTLYWLLTSVHSAEFIKLPATGAPIRVAAMEIDRIVDGKIVAIWRLFDIGSLMTQLRAAVH